MAGHYISHGKILGMWNETKHGLYKQFVFTDFNHAWKFMQQVAPIIQQQDHHPRWQNEWNVVEFWLTTHNSKREITEKDWELANAIDALVAEPEIETTEETVEENASVYKELQLYADGGSRGNPGPSASGFVLLDMDEKVLLEHGSYLGITTNNQAEYQALKLGLEAALHTFHARKVHVYMDSMLVVNQMKRVFKVKNRDLWPIHDAITKLLPQFKEVTFDHVPRELNKLADAEVNKALDSELGSNAQHVV